MRLQPVILSGGTGTRLWPVSRTAHPKQLQEFCGEATLLQQAAGRLRALGDIERPIIVCNDEQRFMIAEQLREAGLTPGMIILEPVGRSTAPALAIAALKVAHPEDTVLVVMPADHFVTDVTAFEECVRQAADQAMQGRLMTFGITPKTPHTGFGYIEMGEPLQESKTARKVKAFREKPDAATAEAYVADGRHVWNSGIFVFRADLYLSELSKFQPEIVAACSKAVANSREDLDFLRLDTKAFSESPSLSIDYGIMEKTDKAGVLPATFDWSDIGSWSALWDVGNKDKDSNVVCGEVVLRDVSGSYIRSDSRLVAALGLKNIAVIETADAVLVADLSRTEDVKHLVADLRKLNRSEEHNHERVWRPWGYYEHLNSGDRFQVKLIFVKPEGKLSLQLHHHRAEHWVVVSGTAKITCGDQVKIAGPNEAVYVPIGERHRLENPGKLPLYLIEVQSGDYLGEDDIVRFEDIYRRVV